MNIVQAATTLIATLALAACGLGETAATATLQAKQAEQAQQQMTQLKQQIDQANTLSNQHLQQATENAQ